MLTRSAWILFSLLAMWQQRPRSGVPTAAQEFRIGGIVQDGTSGLPLEGADVWIERSGPDAREDIVPVTTPAGGHFAFEHVVAGKYVLSARRHGYARQKYEQHEGFSTAIVVGPQRDSEHIVFALFPEAVIAGQVIDDFGEPVRRAKVMLYVEDRTDGRTWVHRSSESGIEDYRTDDQGRYRFGGLQKGRYYVAVSARPWYAQNITAESMAGGPAPDPTALREVVEVEQNESLDVVYPLTFYAGTTDSARASTISLEPGEMVTADVSLAAVPALHLRLTAPGLDLSQPINVSVGLSGFGLPAAFAETPLAWQDIESIGIVGVPPGEIHINAQSVGDTKTPLLFNETLNASQGMEINLNHQARGVPVSGIAKIPQGAHLPERSSFFLREVETGRFSQAQIKPDGSFDFGDGVIPGKYVPALSFAGLSNWYVSEVQADGAEVSGRVVDLQAVNPVRLTLSLSDAVGRVEGVALKDGKGIDGIMVLLVSKELLSNEVAGRGSVLDRNQSDSDGSFAFADMPPGDYTVLAIQNGWDEDWGDPSVLQGWLGDGIAVRVVPNGKVSVRVNVQ
ncbi:MAG: hypothetical protein DMG49_00275 [Acidobacteria bacterium]|nr:MAG: hypothetical protein DMG49_00275 [Acidobacteriota bacterium]